MTALTACGPFKVQSRVRKRSVAAHVANNWPPESTAATPPLLPFGTVCAPVWASNAIKPYSASRTVLSARRHVWRWSNPPSHQEDLQPQYNYLLVQYGDLVCVGPVTCELEWYREWRLSNAVPKALWLPLSSISTSELMVLSPGET